jgi:polysaccharide export outer membrane protein
LYQAVAGLRRQDAAPNRQSTGAAGVSVTEVAAVPCLRSMPVRPAGHRPPRRQAFPEVDVTRLNRPDPIRRQTARRGFAAATLRLALAIVLALPAAGCGASSTGSTPLAKAGNAKADEDYVIGSGDQLSVFVYHNPDLSEAGVAVRPDGRISTPLIDDIVAAGKTPTQLAREIEKKLAKYIQDPNVTVIVRSFVGPSDRQVRVIGEATDPVAIPYRDGMTLLDVMIATKGLTKFAAGNRAQIVRLGTNGKQQVIKVRLSELIKDGDISQNIAMQPGDTLIIPQSWF